MSETNNTKKINIHTWIILGLSLAFYMAMYFMFGVKLFSDSTGYINMDSTREPVYPLFLAIAGIFGKTIQLEIVAIVQNIFMALSVTYLAVTIRNTYKLKDYMMYFVAVMNFAVAFAGQFLSLNGCVYSNSILTEGIALQMYLVFFALLIKAVNEGGIKYETIMAVLAALMMDTRKHMAIVYIICFAALFFARIGKKEFVKKMAVSFMMIILSVAAATAGNYLYNLAVRGEMIKNTRDMNLVITTSLYVCDREDADLIQDEDARNIFIKVYDELDKKQANIKYAEGGIVKLSEHYSNSFDVITIDTTLPMLEEDAVSRGFSDGLEAEMEADRVSKVILSAILKDNLGKYAKVYISSVYNGLVNTVAKRNTILDIYAMIAYICYIIIMAVLARDKDKRPTAFFGFVVLGAILVNVLVTSALIFCQPRYMMYNMALFYIAGGIMLYTLICNPKNREE